MCIRSNASLAKGQKFTKLDLKDAYAQIPLSEEAKKYTHTTKGLFQYTRLPFGVAAAPAIFQRTMETVLQGIPNTCVYLDDILITGESDEQDFGQGAKPAGRSRCPSEEGEMLLPSVEYLGLQGWPQTGRSEHCPSTKECESAENRNVELLQQIFA